MLIHCHCKINLGLKVIGKRPDGYHNLESLFYPVPFGDTLEISLDENHSEGIFIQYSGLPFFPADEDILAKAYRNLSKFATLPAVNIHLHKRIPPGTGLGGGSSNAAHFLLAMKNLAKLSVKDAELQEVALQSGSDCPFFLQDKPAIVRGRGEDLQAYPEILKGWYLVVLYAGIERSTRSAFADLQLSSKRLELEAILCQDPGSWAGLLQNDFEAQALVRFPEMMEQRQRLCDSGAIYASLTGSGSCMYGIFPSKPETTFPDALIETYL